MKKYYIFKNSIYHLSIYLFLVLLSSVSAAAQLTIDITKGNIDPTPVAVPDFLSENPELSQLGEDMASVIRNNLKRSGLFVSLNPEGFLETQVNIDYQPNFSSWRVINAQALVSGRIVSESSNKLRVEFRLWDIFAGKQLIGMRFITKNDQWRRAAHKASDEIYKALTGEIGYFDSRIVFIDEKGSKLNRKKSLAIMDQDGHGVKLLTNGSQLILTPRFSPSAQKIVYLSYENITPSVYLLDIETGKRTKLGSYPGMTFAPRFSSDGNKLLLSMIKGGNSDIYSLDLNSGLSTRLTNDSSIDVSGSYSPDGKQIVFNSDRGGNPHLYIMNSDGTNKKRISFGEGRYSSPVWSPRGDKIAFVKSLNGKFSISVINPDGSDERALTESFMDEGPAWSPNGRVIVFSRETRGRYGSNSIWSVDLTGRNLKKVNTPGKASDPAWSPLLP